MLGLGTQLRSTAAPRYPARAWAENVDATSTTLGEFQERYYGPTSAATMPEHGLSGIGGGDHALGPDVAQRTQELDSLQAAMRGSFQDPSAIGIERYVPFPENTPGRQLGPAPAAGDLTKTESKRPVDLFEKTGEDAADVLRTRRQMHGYEIGQTPVVPTRALQFAREERKAEYERLRGMIKDALDE